MSGATNGSAGEISKQAVKTETHRQYAIDLKRRIVEETFAPGSSVSIVARQHNVNANMVLSWRKKYRAGTLIDTKRPAKPAVPGPNLIRIGVIDPGKDLSPLSAVNDSRNPSPQTWEHSSAIISGLVEIELPNKIKARVPADVNETVLRRVLTVIRETA
jgi:transposase